jgi:hypothetical protein
MMSLGNIAPIAFQAVCSVLLLLWFRHRAYRQGAKAGVTMAISVVTHRLLNAGFSTEDVDDILACHRPGCDCAASTSRLSASVN